MRFSQAHSVFNILFLIGLCLVLVGLPFNKLMISLGVITVGGVWAISGHYQEKIRQLKSSKSALALISIYFLFVLGSLYTSDGKEAIEELRVMLPMLVFPLVFPFYKKTIQNNLYWLLHLFVLAVVANSVLSYLNYVQSPELDGRKIVLFLSHIRYGLMLVLAVAILVHYAIKNQDLYRILAITLIVWLSFFLTIFASGTGLVVYIAVAVVSFIYFAFKSEKKSMKITLMIPPIVLLMIVPLIAYSLYQNYFDVPQVDIESMDKITANGESYIVPAKNNMGWGTIENENYTQHYLAPNELFRNWNRIANIKHNEKSGSGFEVQYNLIRYMTSKGLRKDSIGLTQLTPQDIALIEKGFTNHLIPTQSKLSRKINETLFEIDVFKNNLNMDFSPTVGRVYFWDATLNLIEKNLWIGMGTGSVESELTASYQEIATPLGKKSRKRTHNQYLTILAQFGIIGFVWFIAAFGMAFFNGNMHYLKLITMVIILLSFINEDTLNTQAGATFVALFASLFFLLED